MVYTNKYMGKEVVIYRIHSAEDIIEICEKFHIPDAKHVASYFSDKQIKNDDYEGGLCIRINIEEPECIYGITERQWGMGSYDFYVEEGLKIKDWTSESKYVVDLL